MRDFFGYVIAIVFVGLFIYYVSRPTVQLRCAGKVNEGLFGPSTFDVSVWHQNEGDLSNGKLTVTVKGKGLNPPERSFEYSFDKWPPNQEHARIFTVKFLKYDPSERIEVLFSVNGAWHKETVLKDVWVNGRWTQ